MRNLGLAVVALSLGSPTQAKDWPSSGVFDVLELDNGCALTATYEGPGETEMILSLLEDGDAILLINNFNWTAEEGKFYDDISFHLSSGSYGGGTVSGSKIGYKRGFATRVKPGFIKDFAMSGSLHVSKADETIDRLSLKGSSAAIANARKCNSQLFAQRKLEMRERMKLEDLPVDPFAKDHQ